MKLEFRIDFGYSMLYSRRQYHGLWVWDGELKCERARVLETRALHYPKLWVCPAHSPQTEILPGPFWKLNTRRDFQGVAFTVEAEENAVFSIQTASGTWNFTVQELLTQGRIVFNVGPKYAFCKVMVTRKGFYWFRPPVGKNTLRWTADELPLPVHEWSQMRTAWLAPGARMKLSADLPEIPGGKGDYLLHLAMMLSPRAYEADPTPLTTGSLPDSEVCKAVAMDAPPWESQLHARVAVRFLCDGKEIACQEQYLREHDFFVQLLEDFWLRFQTAPGKHELVIENTHQQAWMLFSLCEITVSPRRHGMLTVPEWALVGEELTGRVYAETAGTLTIHTPNGAITVNAQAGWNEFPVKLDQSGTDFVFRCNGEQAVLHAVYSTREEAVPVMVGYDMTIVPHNDDGFMDWLLDYTDRTRLGNLPVFRSFLFGPGTRDMDPVDDKLLERWGRFCADHHLHAAAATDYLSGALLRGAGKVLHNVGPHEISGALYALDPQPEDSASDMKDASMRYIQYLKPVIDKIHAAGERAGFGEASGASRYAYAAGLDFVRAETMVPHTQHLCSQVRAASKALGDGTWGVHIAIQHAAQPFDETHLRLFFLSLVQPWMMGANMLYEEDSIFLMFKEERQTWHDRLTSGKREMLRNFFRFVKTHPRQGKNVVPIAFLEGRYAAPFNDFICAGEQTPDYSVWGRFGRNEAAWGHRQPEKCRQLLNVLMPGASTLPLRQRFDKRRFYFSGTPYGDFDQLPVEAKQEFFNSYKLLLNLGWNTMLDEDYAKLKRYVEQGGTLLTGLPQFSTHVKRDFLLEMEDLSLYNSGDLRDLCGFRVTGKNGVYSGQWNGRDETKFTDPALIGLPNHHWEEDGPACRAAIELAPGAKVVAWDALDGAPLVVCNTLGKGKVYTFTFHAYPGHEAFQKLSAAWIEHLASEVDAQQPVKVSDPSGEVFRTFWQTGKQSGVLMLLNTDWTTAGNVRSVEITGPDFSWQEAIHEGDAVRIYFAPGIAIIPPMDMHVEVLEDGSYRLHGIGKQCLRLRNINGEKTISVDFGQGTVLPFQPNL